MRVRPLAAVALLCTPLAVAARKRRRRHRREHVAVRPLAACRPASTAAATPLEQGHRRQLDYRQFAPQFGAGLSVTYDWQQWSFSNPTRFGGSAPWRDIYQPQIGAT
ncbi:MAG: hypothetical protein U1F10_04180 [Burkholderiales bacterium]